jgi:hypothetical protein
LSSRHARQQDIYLDKSNYVPERPEDVPHEFATKAPYWEGLWNVNPEAVEKEIEHIRTHHIVDNETGEFNRHNVGNPAYHKDVKKNPCCISVGGGHFLYAFSFLYSKTGNKTYLDASKLLCKFYRTAEGEMGIPADSPDISTYDPSNKNAGFCGAGIAGTLCYALLKSYELTGDEQFKDQAMQYLNIYGKLAYDELNEKFFARVDKDTGEVMMGARWNSGETPLGHIDLWQPYHLATDFTTAQSYAYAYYLTKDPEMLYYAEKWAFFIDNNPPEDGARRDTFYELYATLYSKYGTYADYYGRIISFYLTLYISTGDNLYFAKAKDCANDAVKKLFYKGFFKGHPARDYYHHIDGIGYLAYALIQLHIAEHEDQFDKHVDVDNY